MVRPTRRTILSLGLLLSAPPFGAPPSVKTAAALLRNPAAAGPHGLAGPSAAFTSRSGVNVVPLGFEIYQPVAIASWEAALPRERLCGLRTAGFEHVRIAFDPSPALAASSAEALADVMAVARHAVEATLGCGLKAILDLHVAVQGPYGTASIEADYPTGAHWQRYIEVARQFARMCGGYPVADLALELYNENSNSESYGNNAWAERAQALWKAARSVNHKTTLLVGGSFYSSIEGLADLKAGDFDANTGFVVHNYNPAIFTHQNAASYTRYVQRLHYPPIQSDRNAAIEGMAARVDASDLAPADKQRAKTDRSRRLASYFDTPQGPDYVLANVRKIGDWQLRNSVPSSRIFITEFGSHNDHDFPGADLIARMAWLQDTDRAHQAAGYCRSVWNYNSPDYWDITAEDGRWQIRPGLLISLGQVPAAGLEPEAAALIHAQAKPPSLADQALLSETIRQLKAYGLWAKLEMLVVFAGPFGSPVEWKRPGAWRAALGQLSLGQGLGLANPNRAAASLRLAREGGTEADPPPLAGGHVGLMSLGSTEAPPMTLGHLGGPPLMVLAGAGRVSSGDATCIARGDMTVLHAMVSHGVEDGTTLYINGSASGLAMQTAPVTQDELALTLPDGMHGGCGAVHTGGDLSADDARALFTILRWYVKGSERNALAFS